jgi:hypothetical protein
MATYKILYWRDIPSQVRAEDSEDEVTVPMPAKFMERIDYLAMRGGLAQSDDFLAHWQWSEETERAGAAREVAEAVAAELTVKVTW